MEHPKDVGDKTTVAVMLALQALGLRVLVPFGENTRYDLVIDDGKSLQRVQCKTGRLRNGAVKWSVCSNYSHHRNARTISRPYFGEIDLFGVYCNQTGGVYLVPIGDLNVASVGTLRVDPPRNSQSKRIRYAGNYEIGRVTVEAPEGRLNL